MIIWSEYDSLNNNFIYINKQNRILIKKGSLFYSAYDCFGKKGGEHLEGALLACACPQPRRLQWVIDNIDPRLISMDIDATITYHKNYLSNLIDFKFK